MNRKINGTNVVVICGEPAGGLTIYDVNDGVKYFAVNNYTAAPEREDVIDIYQADAVAFHISRIHGKDYGPDVDAKIAQIIIAHYDGCLR